MTDNAIRYAYGAAVFEHESYTLAVGTELKPFGVTRAKSKDPFSAAGSTTAEKGFYTHIGGPASKYLYLLATRSYRGRRHYEGILIIDLSITKDRAVVMSKLPVSPRSAFAPSNKLVAFMGHGAVLTREEYESQGNEIPFQLRSRYFDAEDINALFDIDYKRTDPLPVYTKIVTRDGEELRIATPNQKRRIRIRRT